MKNQAMSLSQIRKVGLDALVQAVSDRNLHKDLLHFCMAELLQDNYFHAVLEATKSVASKVRSMTGLNSDGAQLIDDAFGGPDPILKINAFKTDTEKSEQRGFTNLAKGLFGTFRNPTAHAPKIGKETINQWTNQISQSTDPRIIPEIEQIKVSGKTIIAVKITENPIKPVSTKGRCQRGQSIYCDNDIVYPDEIKNTEV